ncbi:hypothetical protein V8C86DRAFT_1462001 [Haematococcus lacustris]
MARRFQHEAAPLLGKLLAQGPTPAAAAAALAPRQPLLLPSTPAGHSSPAARQPGNRQLSSSQPAGGGVTPGGGGAGEGGEGHAPAALRRVRLAVLSCLQAVCSCREAETAVKGLVWPMAQAAVPFLSRGHPPELQEAAGRLLQQLASLDPDAVWLLLWDVVADSDQAGNAVALRLLHGLPVSANGDADNRRGCGGRDADNALGHAQLYLASDLMTDAPPHPLLWPLRAALPSLHGRSSAKAASARQQTDTASRRTVLTVAACCDVRQDSEADNAATDLHGVTKYTPKGDSYWGRPEDLPARSSARVEPRAPELLPHPAALTATSSAAVAWAVTPQVAAACSKNACALLTHLVVGACEGDCR